MPLVPLLPSSIVLGIDSFAPAVPEKLEVKRALSSSELLRCRELVYEAYAQKGYLLEDTFEARRGGTFHSNRTHASPAARRTGQVFFVESAPQVVAATGTLIRQGPGDLSTLPLWKPVKAELIKLSQSLGPDAVLAEMGGLASTGQGSGTLRALRTGVWDGDALTTLFAGMHANAQAQGITDLVIGVHPSHTGFYRRLGFTAVGATVQEGLPDYAGLQHAALALLHAPLEDMLCAQATPIRH